MKNISVSIACLLSVVALTGCGESNNDAKITGTITINGAPIENGSITFVAVDGVAPTGGGVIKDGKYTALVAPGSKTVMVLGNRVTGEEPEYQGVADSPMRTTYQTVTPAKYNAAHLSPLKADIEGDQDGLNFELTGDPPKPEKGF